MCSEEYIFEIYSKFRCNCDFVPLGIFSIRYYNYFNICFRIITFFLVILPLSCVVWLLRWPSFLVDIVMFVSLYYLKQYLDCLVNLTSYKLAPVLYLVLSPSQLKVNLQSCLILSMSYYKWFLILVHLPCLHVPIFCIYGYKLTSSDFYCLFKYVEWSLFCRRSAVYLSANHLIHQTNQILLAVF